MISRYPFFFNDFFLVLKRSRFSDEFCEPEDCDRTIMPGRRVVIRRFFGRANVGRAGSDQNRSFLDNEDTR